MDDHNIRRYQRATRVLTFCRDRADEFTPTSKITTHADALATIIEKLERARVGQLRSPVGKPSLIEALNIDFKDIFRTARAIRLDDPTFPAAAYRHPRTKAETPVATHADALLALLEDQPTDTQAQKTAKAALRARFIDYELPADFVADLRADRDALTQSNQAKHSDNEEGLASTAEIEELLGKASEMVTRLDAAILNKYRNSPSTIAAWKSISRVERAPRKAKPAAPPAPGA